MLDVYRMTPVLAGTLCRFCLKVETAHEPHYQMDWYKWPNSEVTRLFQQVVGEQMPVSSHLTERFCSSCQWWLKETNDKMQVYKKNVQLWNDYLNVQVKPVAVRPMKTEPSPVVDAPAEEGDHTELDDMGFKIEYLEVDMYDEEGTEQDCGDEIITDEQILASDPNQSVAEGDEEFDEHQPMSDEHALADDGEVTSANEADDGHILMADGSIGWTYWNVRKPLVECEMCGKQFKRKYCMVRHFEQEHNLVNKFSCASCPKVFPTKEAVDLHTRVHPQDIVFKCEICDKLYDSEYYLRRHQRTVHGPVRPIPCPECHKVFFNRAKLSNHMQRHGEKTEQCDECGRKFHMKKDLKLHIQVVHQQIRRFVCESCGHQFTCKVSLQSHVARGCLVQKRRSLPDSTKALRRELSCTECEMKCMRPGTLQRHYERVHPDADWAAVAECICVKCLRQFESVDAIDEHNAKHHPVWQCDICKTVLTTELSLERHRKIHTAKERPFTCAVCEGTYVTQHQLKMHFRRKHTNERPFACPTCDRRYADRSEMNVHIRSAHGNERHQCADCPKSFNSAKYLGLHVAREHTGDFNFFECTMCNGRYVNARVLAEHQAVHHPKTT